MAHPYQMSALLVVHCCIVFEADPTLAPESVSSFALEVLDELRMRMLECLLVLQALPEEADLNFDEIENDIHTVSRGARNAYEAASLVHQGAALGERWVRTCRDPRRSSPVTMPPCARALDTSNRYVRSVTASSASSGSCRPWTLPKTSWGHARSVRGWFDLPESPA